MLLPNNPAIRNGFVQLIRVGHSIRQERVNFLLFLSACEDESDYCSIVKLLKMCHYSNFQQRCCFTCSEEYYYDEENDLETNTDVTIS